MKAQILPLLKGIPMSKKIVYMGVLCNIAFFLGCNPPSPASPSASPTVNGPKLVIVKGSFTTTANNGSGGQGINIDAVGGVALPFNKVKRYTVTLHTALLSTAPAGINRIEVYTGVLTGAGSSYGVRVIKQDPSTASPFPNPGLTILPYIGTGSYIKVFRGADGLGSVEVTFNAYVEVEP